MIKTAIKRCPQSRNTSLSMGKSTSIYKLYLKSFLASMNVWSDIKLPSGSTIVESALAGFPESDIGNIPIPQARKMQLRETSKCYIAYVADVINLLDSTYFKDLEDKDKSTSYAISIIYAASIAILFTILIVGFLDILQDHTQSRNHPLLAVNRYKSTVEDSDCIINEIKASNMSRVNSMSANQLYAMPRLLVINKSFNN